MISIVDYGMGNLGSIVNMFKRIGVAAQISGDPGVLMRASKILLPGVGSFDSAMQRIESSGLRGVLDYKALQERVPILGICLGMQLLTRSSEEGKCAGLNWIAASTRRFAPTLNLKVPHMGWNAVQTMRPSLLTQELSAEARFYFVHSYYVAVDHEEDSLLKTHYGLTFDAAVARDNIYGAQFHPEKSHRFGMQLLANFARV